LQSLALLLFTGCINRSPGTMAPGQNLDQASTGLDIDTPERTDVVVTYEDRGQWDMTMYKIELTIYVMSIRYLLSDGDLKSDAGD